MGRSASANRSPSSLSWSYVNRPRRWPRHTTQRAAKRPGLPSARLAHPFMPIKLSERVLPIRWLHLGFALTGFGTTLLGCLVPALTAIWPMNDHRTGILFAAQFSGASLGALLVGSNFFSSVVGGYLLLIASAVSI